MNDVVINKAASIQRCVKRARDERARSQDFFSDYTHQDAAILNVTRACEQTIDLANHVIREKKLGIPTDSGDSFGLLATEKFITEDLAGRLKKMVGFRNIAVHEYQELEPAIVVSVIDRGLDDLVEFVDRVVETVG